MVKTLMADSKHSSETFGAHCKLDHLFDTIFYPEDKATFIILEFAQIQSMKQVQRMFRMTFFPNNLLEVPDI